MRDPLLTYISPCRPNFVYSVETFDTIPNIFGALLDTIHMERVNLPRVLIYCQNTRTVQAYIRSLRKGWVYTLLNPLMLLI